MAANEGSKYTNFSNVEIGTANGGGGLKVNGSAINFNSQAQNFDVETVTATNIISASENGKTFILSSATEFVSTLPTLASGLRYKFIIGAAPSGANYTIVSSTNVIEGLAVVNGATVAAVNENTISFVSAAAAVGDWVELVCDGTSWFVSGQGAAAGAITFTAP